MDSLGVVTVTTHGTPVQLTSGGTSCTQISLQACRALGASGTPPTENTGVIYLMRGNVSKATGGGHCVTYIKPQDGLFSLRSAAHMNLADYYLDSDTDGDGALVSFE